MNLEQVIQQGKKGVELQETHVGASCPILSTCGESGSGASPGPQDRTDSSDALGVCREIHQFCAHSS